MRKIILRASKEVKASTFSFTLGKPIFGAMPWPVKRVRLSFMGKYFRNSLKN